jgi:hypothetical protein
VRLALGAGVATFASALAFLHLPRAAQAWWLPGAHPGSHLPLPAAPRPAVLAADTDEVVLDDGAAPTVVTDVSLAAKLALSAAAGVASAALFLPALRYSRCLHEARDSLSEAGAAGSPLAAASRAVAWTTAGFAGPLLVLAAFVGPLLGSPVEALGWSESTWGYARVALAACAVALQLAALRPGVQVALAAGRKRMVDTLLRTASLAVRLHDRTDGAPAGGSKPKGGATAADDAPPAVAGHGLSEESVQVVLKTLQVESLKPLVASSLAALQLLAVPVALGCLTALYARLGGVAAAASAAVRAALKDAAGIDTVALLARRATAAAAAHPPPSEEFLRLRAMLADVFPAAAAAVDPATARGALGFLLVAVAASVAAAQAGGLLYWARVQPSMAAAAAADDARAAAKRAAGAAAGTGAPAASTSAGGGGGAGKKD